MNLFLSEMRFVKYSDIVEREGKLVFYKVMVDKYIM